MRMTRASRSAVEGGRRETTRRDRWFDKALNLQLVMRTGGDGWAGVVRARSDEGSLRSTREGSVKTVADLDTVMGQPKDDDGRAEKNIGDVDDMDELA